MGLYKRLRELQPADQISFTDCLLLLAHVAIPLIVIRVTLGLEVSRATLGFLILGFVLFAVGKYLWDSIKVLFAEDSRGRRWEIMCEEFFFIPQIARIFLLFGALVFLS